MLIFLTVVILLVIMIFPVVFFFWILNLTDRVSTLEKRIAESPNTGRAGMVKTTETAPLAAPQPPTTLEANTAVPVPAYEQSARPQEQHKDFEFKLGSRLFTGIGVVALLFGVGFFLRYAFDNNLITPLWRVVLGLVFGLVLVGIGSHTTKKFFTYGQIVIGGGLGMLYLSLYAAYAYYGITSQTTAFIGMILVTACGVWLATHYNSLALAVFAVLGGFMTPVLLSTGENRPHALFLYIALLDLGIFCMAWFKLWRSLLLIGFVATVMMYVAWFAQFYTDAQFGIAQGYASLFFVIFFATLFVHHFVRKTLEDGVDLLILSLTSALYFLVSFVTIDAKYPDLMGVWTVIFSLFHFVLALGLRAKDLATAHFRQFLVGIGIVLLTLAIPIQLTKHWITISWALEALILLHFRFSLPSKMLRFFSYGIFSAAFVRLCFLDSTISASAEPWVNDRFISFAACALIFFLSALLYAKKRNAGVPLAEEESVAFEGLFLVAYLVVFWLATVEVFEFHPLYWLGIVWAAVALIGGLVSLAMDGVCVRYAAYATFAAAGIRLLGFESRVAVATYTPLLNIRALSFLIVTLVIWLFTSILQRKENVPNNEKTSVLVCGFLAINTLLLTLLSVELRDYFRQQLLQLPTPSLEEKNKFSNLQNVSLSIGWALYAFILLTLGIIKKSIHARQLAIALLGVVVFKVFLYDTSNLDTPYKIISFITLGVLLLLAGYGYNRYKDRIAQFIKS